MTTEDCAHEWVVYSTAMVKPTIMVKCQLCGVLAGVQEFTPEEWALAFYAPSMPFRWADSGRVLAEEDLDVGTEEERQMFRDFLDGKLSGVTEVSLTRVTPHITALSLTHNETGLTLERTFDEDGNVTGERTFDKDGNLTDIPF